jgi:hypothetical protein
MPVASLDQDIDINFANALGLRASQIPIVLVNQLELAIEALPQALFRVSVSSEIRRCGSEFRRQPEAGPVEGEETRQPPAERPALCCRAILSPPEPWPSASPQVTALLPQFHIAAGAGDSQAGELTVKLTVGCTPKLSLVSPDHGCRLFCRPDYVAIDVTVTFDVTLGVEGTLKQARPPTGAGLISPPVSMSFGPNAGSHSGNYSYLTGNVSFNFEVSFSFAVTWEFDFLCGRGLGPRGTLQPVTPAGAGSAPGASAAPGGAAVGPLGTDPEDNFLQVCHRERVIVRAGEEVQIEHLGGTPAGSEPCIEVTSDGGTDELPDTDARSTWYAGPMTLILHAKDKNATGGRTAIARVHRRAL